MGQKNSKSGNVVPSKSQIKPSICKQTDLVEDKEHYTSVKEEYSKHTKETTRLETKPCKVDQEEKVDVSGTDGKQFEQQNEKHQQITPVFTVSPYGDIESCQCIPDHDGGSNLVEENGILRQQISKLKATLDNAKQKRVKLEDKSKLQQQHLDMLDNEKLNLVKKNQELEDGRMVLLREVDILKEQLKDENRILVSKEIKVNEYKAERTRTQNDFPPVGEGFSRLQQDIHLYKRRPGEVERENEQLRQCIVPDPDITKLRRRIQQQELEKESLLKEIDAVKTRLSEVMSEKITDGNPNIADLSDQYRPANIADRFMELYNNQWNGAFEIIQKHTKCDDRVVIDILLKIVMDVYRMCCHKAGMQLQTLLKHTMEFTGLKQESDVSLRQFKDLRKHNFRTFLGPLNETADEIAVKCIHGLKTKPVAIRDYVDRVTELCWLMGIQDPPVYMQEHFKTGEHFDKNVFAEYTVTGSKNDYMVWPPLFLHKDGPLLRKGVAQPKENKPRPKTDVEKIAEKRLGDLTTMYVKELAPTLRTVGPNVTMSVVEKFGDKSAQRVASPESEHKKRKKKKNFLKIVPETAL